MDIIMIPGMWLDASSWDAVAPVLEQAGHRPPDWSEFGAEDLGGLDDAARGAFRERAIPFPAYAASEPQRLPGDRRRYAVPVTMICTEFSGATLREWIGDGEALVREFPKIADVTYVDLPTGHWPQFTRPADLGRAIIASV
jgi:pimeloyl-ACP methyl ester carboxylesterase